MIYKTYVCTRYQNMYGVQLLGSPTFLLTLTYIRVWNVAVLSMYNAPDCNSKSVVNLCVDINNNQKFVDYIRAVLCSCLRVSYALFFQFEGDSRCQSHFTLAKFKRTSFKNSEVFIAGTSQ